MSKIDDILDIMEPGAELTEEQLALLDDTEMRAAAEDIVLAQQVLTPKPEDVEERLEEFKRKRKRWLCLRENPKEQWRKRRLRIATLSVSLIAAVFIGALFLLKPADKEKYLFEADQDVCPQLSDAYGNPVKLRMHRQEGEADPVVLAEECHSDESNAHRDTMKLSIPKGSSYRLDLTDGTRVYLYPGSCIEYPCSFGPRSRDVRLSGEAYFVVSKDAKRPFTVTTDQSITSVLGTEFSIRSQYGKPESLTLVNGHVRFTGKHNAQTVDVYPGEKVSIGTSGYISVEPADTMGCVSWRDGFIYYDEAQLGDILCQIGRQFNVNIICKNPALQKLRMHFVFRRDQDIHDAVRMLNKMKKVNARIEGNNLIVN